MKKLKKLNVFIVDDDKMFAKALENFILTRINNVEVSTFATGEACLHSIHLGPDVIILDYVLNSEFPYAWSGLDILKKVNRMVPYVTVVMISSQNNIGTVLKTLDEGSAQYVVKDEQAFDKIHGIIKDALDNMGEEELEKSEQKSIFNIMMVCIALLFFISFMLFV